MIFQSIDNETELLRKLAQGHESAFRQLFESYGEEVYSVAFLHLKLPYLAEDIVQTVFLTLWERRQDVQHLDHFPSWLYTLARNTIISSLRKQASSDTYKQFLKEHMELSTDSPEHLLLRKEQKKLVQSAIDQLSLQQRTAFLLQREEGLSYEIIGQRMGISTNTVRGHLYKAMESIRAYVHAHGSDSVTVLWVLYAGLVKNN